MQPDFLINLIGTCHSCMIDKCIKPKARTLRPENGCTNWQTPATKAYMKTIKTEPVED